MIYDTNNILITNFCNGRASKSRRKYWDDTLLETLGTIVLDIGGSLYIRNNFSIHSE